MVGNFLSSSVITRGVCEELAARLSAAGWRVLTTSNKQNRVKRLADMIDTLWRRRRDYEVAHVDVFSGPAFSWAEAVCWSLKRINKPYILTLHGGDLPSFGERWPLRLRRLLSSAALVTTPSRYLQDRMKAYCNELLLVPNPLEISAYEFRLRRRPLPRLVWLRAFHSIYGPSVAAKTLARVLRELPDAHLTMIGPDKGDGSLQETRQLVRELGIADRVDILGPVSKTDVPKLLNSGDLFLNTAKVDNTPISVLEAMACGLCVISANVGGIPYLLEDGHDALLVPPDDVEGMANAVLRICQQPGLAMYLSTNARATAGEFDWAHVLPRWEQLLCLTGR
jgi:glycosyltransferase involved in cell wall biosynthesis